MFKEYSPFQLLLITKGASRDEEERSSSYEILNRYCGGTTARHLQQTTLIYVLHVLALLYAINAISQLPTQSSCYLFRFFGGLLVFLVGPAPINRLFAKAPFIIFSGTGGALPPPGK